MNTSKTQVTKDFAAKCIKVSREFEAPLALVWRAYTEAELLDQWWGPAPYRAETKSLQFLPGGSWIYAMVGPQGQKHWGRMNYVNVEHQRSIEIEDVFCDEHGNVNPALPIARGTIVFTPMGRATRVEFTTFYAQESDLQTVVEMGFEQGISICLDQLTELLRNTRVQ